MRDIKFRVFNKERNVMMSGVNQYGYEEPDNNIRTSSAGAFTRLWESLARINESDNHVLMQFTGLTDKNGVDIYEGDIVKTQNEWDDEDDHIIYTVKYGAFGFSNTVGFHCFDVDGDIWEFYGGMPDTKEFIVIGNIHEDIY